MEGSIVIAKSESGVINLDSVQYSITIEKDRVSFSGDALHKSKSIEEQPLNVGKVSTNLIVPKGDTFVRMNVENKKATKIKGADFKPDKDKRKKLEERLAMKYGRNNDNQKSVKGR